MNRGFQLGAVADFMVGSMKIDRTGCTRIVVLTKRHAFKVPNVLNGYKLFLCGLLANFQEKEMFDWRPRSELCPVRFALPLGFLVVMPRVRIMTDIEFEEFEVEAFTRKPTYSLPVEAKANSFGYLNGSIVAIDYGGYGG